MRGLELILPPGEHRLHVRKRRLFWLETARTLAQPLVVFFVIFGHKILDLKALYATPFFVAGCLMLTCYFCGSHLLERSTKKEIRKLEEKYSSAQIEQAAGQLSEPRSDEAGLLSNVSRSELALVETDTQTNQPKV